MSSIWRDREFLARSPAAQRAYMMILSQSDLNHCGVIPPMIRRWASYSPGTSAEDVEEALKELEDHGRFVVRDVETEELLIRTFIRNDGVYKQPNVFEAACREASGIVSGTLRGTLREELQRLPVEEMAEKSKRSLNALVATLGEGLPEPLPEPLAEPSKMPSLGLVESPGGSGGGSGSGSVSSSENSSSVGARKRGTRLPKDWVPSSEDIAWQREKSISDFVARRELEKFRNHWPAQPGQKGVKLDWSLTWRNWLIRAQETTTKPEPPKRPPGWEYGMN